MTGRDLDADSESRARGNTDVVTKLILITWPNRGRKGGKGYCEN